MEVHVINIMMIVNGDRYNSMYCGNIGYFTSTKTFDEAWERASKTVIPRLNEWAKDGYEFELFSAWMVLDDFNDNWETMEPKELLELLD